MSLPKVTFYMMAYNTEKYIEKSVRSVLHQTESDVNIYIRNNGSTDKTGEILEKLQKEDSRVHVITNKVNGLGENGELAFQKEWWYNESQELGEYIAIIDSDDWLEPDFVEKLYKLAKENDSEIVSAGCYFRGENGKIVRMRNNVNANKITLYDIGDKFPIIYNNFRTWWGKLFKKEFFFNNYDFAWLSKLHIWLGHPYSKIDTTIMMGYLNKCENLSCIDIPLYNCLMRTDSTYNHKTLCSFGDFTGAYAIYQHMMMNLKKFNLLSESNIKFAENIHWTYILEQCIGLSEMPDMTVSEKYEWLEYVFKDDVTSTYIDKRLSDKMPDIKRHLTELENKYAETEDIYKYYLARLNCFLDMYAEGNVNPLSVVILFSVICDIRNSTDFGKQYFKVSISNNSKALKAYSKFNDGEKKFFHTYPKLNYLSSLDFNENIENSEKQMENCWENNRISEAVDLAVKIIEQSPFNLKALVCIMLYFYSVDSVPFANLIKHSIAVLWNENDINEAISLLKGTEQINEK